MHDFCALWEGLLAYQFVAQGRGPCERDVCYLRRRILCRCFVRTCRATPVQPQQCGLCVWRATRATAGKSPFHLPAIVRSSCGCHRGCLKVRGFGLGWAHRSGCRPALCGHGGRNPMAIYPGMLGRRQYSAPGPLTCRVSGGGLVSLSPGREETGDGTLLVVNSSPTWYPADRGQVGVNSNPPMCAGLRTV